MFLIFGCVEDIEGEFYLSKDTDKYIIDTTITSMRLIDSYGITESFYVKQDYFSDDFLYLSDYGNGIIHEYFSISYRSTLNNYLLDYVLRAGIDGTELIVEWNQNTRFQYNFKTKDISYDSFGTISFYNQLVINEIEYRDVLKIDYSNHLDKINNDIPVQIYFSKKGLLKFILKDQNVVVRVH